VTAHEPDASRRARPGDTVSISATLVLRHLAGFRDALGNDTVARGLETLPAQLQMEIEALVAGAWLAVEQVDIIYDAIAREAGRSVESMVPTVIAAANERVFSTVWKALMRLAPGRLILRRAAAVYRKRYTHGVVTTRDLEDGGIEVDLTHWPGITRNRILGISSGIRAILRLSGTSNPQVTHRKTPDGVCFVVRM
jgi:hypothetical protein